jgi:acetyl-CoA carboxylase biotin carboxyl carrier protein
MIDLRYVKKLIEMLDASTVDSIEISSDKGMKLRIAKTPQARGAVQVAAPAAIPTMIAAPAPAALPAAAGRRAPRHRCWVRVRGTARRAGAREGARDQVADGRHVLRVGRARAPRRS